MWPLRKISVQKEAEFEAYVEWLLTPPQYREPSTKKEFAEKFGVERRTLYNWEKSENFARRINDSKAHLAAAWYGDILGRLKSIVDDGPPKDSVAAARVLLNYLVVPEAVAGASEDEQKRLIEALKASGIEVVEKEV